MSNGEGLAGGIEADAGRLLVGPSFGQFPPLLVYGIGVGNGRPSDSSTIGRPSASASAVVPSGAMTACPS